VRLWVRSRPKKKNANKILPVGPQLGKGGGTRKMGCVQVRCWWLGVGARVGTEFGA
jgi:hypothetical protein